MGAIAPSRHDSFPVHPPAASLPVMRHILLAAAGLAAPLLAAAPASACSVVSTYRVPTNLELVERADAIVLATIERAEVAPANGENRPPSLRTSVIARPTLLLKGERLPAEVRIRGWLSDDPGQVVASNPRDLLNPNPGALSGACVRYVFREGMQLVLFLERDAQGQLRMASYPFARSAEDVPSADAPWVKAVRLYAEIAALPQAQRRAALVARRDALGARPDDPDAALLAGDIDRQLNRRRGPSRD